jgi:hypothetical protein
MVIGAFDDRTVGLVTSENKKYIEKVVTII